MTATLFFRLLGLLTSLGVGYLVFDYTGLGEELTHEVSGTIRVAGRPLPSGVVRFISTSNSRPRNAGAFVSNGKYTIPQEDGLLAGKYQVQISGISKDEQIRAIHASQASETASVQLKEPLPARYNMDSEMYVEVAPDGSVLGFDFDLR